MGSSGFGRTARIMLHSHFRQIAAAVLAIFLSASHALAEPAVRHEPCRVEQRGNDIELNSPYFAFHLNTANGLRARFLENRLTGKAVELCGSPELEIDIGLPGHDLHTPQFTVSALEIKKEGAAGEVIFSLAARDPELSAKVTYRWDAKQPVLRKFVEITNKSGGELNRLLNVRLGEYDTEEADVADRPAGGTYSVPAPRQFAVGGNTHVERGFPVYVGNEFFLALAHPAGVAEGSAGKISLRQYPGVRLGAGKSFTCMEAVYGVAAAGEARKTFIAHLRSRMRRVVRGHDKPYTILDNFGSWPGGDFMNKEAYVLHSINRLDESRKTAGVHFDLFSVEFWVDYGGTLAECNPQRFPNGLRQIRQKLDNLETAMGLWIDGSYEGWSIGGNQDPDVQACLNYDVQNPATLEQVQLGRRAFCRATEPIRSMYRQAFCRHIRENGVRLLKFDNTSTICVNPHHEHLPGLYSTEPIVDGLIEFFRALDEECPDVFLMLYWGYKSPWWLLYGDTLFDSGLGIEAASPSEQPAPYLRDSVTQKLDQAQRFAADVPPLGKDSLGVWLSDWGWNSSIGKERWQEGFVMDLCRGSLLAQIWADHDWLSPPEWAQLAGFNAVLKARPECFDNPRFILGDPRKDEPYGYCCTDGRRAFLAVNNCTWSDSRLPLKLNSAWGLPDDRTWDLYRWYPEPARLSGAAGAVDKEISLCLRPFEVVLLEVVPAGEAPSLNRRFELGPVPDKFIEPTRPIELTVEPVRPESGRASSSEEKTVVVRGQLPATNSGGMIILTAEMKTGSEPLPLKNVGTLFSCEGKLAGENVQVQPVLGTATYPSSWQAWRTAATPSAVPRDFQLTIGSTAPANARFAFKAYFIPCSD